MVTFWGVLVVLGVMVVARYGGDPRSGAEPTGPRRHTSGRDTGRRARCARRLAAHQRCWEGLDRSLRPWEPADRPDAGR